MSLSSAILNLRKDPRLLRVPPYLSLLCMLGGIVWVLLLPLNQYSRQTYISENALLPAQVHTYFTGSEQNFFRAYKQELRDALTPQPDLPQTGDLSVSQEEFVDDKIRQLFHSAGLKSASQQYSYVSSGKTYSGTNSYAILNAPRGDGTEAIVLVAALRNAAGEENVNGVSLLITLAHYFKQWSLWSKDIIFLVTSDSEAGPQAWIDAYHSTHDPEKVAGLTLKSGALQGAVCIDYPFDHHFESLHISYDGINGQLPNLDLFNTVVSISSGQMGIGSYIQSTIKPNDCYSERVKTVAKGMASQALGLATGPHSVFMPYHIDAVTLTTVGDGPQDEMALGRTVESTCRSLNNLLEHLHQSFFFYILIQPNRFVSIGTYLPSAMAVAAGFSIMALHLWVKSGCEETDKDRMIAGPASNDQPAQVVGSQEMEKPIQIEDTSETKIIDLLGKQKIPPTDTTPTINTTSSSKSTFKHSKPATRSLLLPLAILSTIHALLPLLPLYIFTGSTLSPTAIPQTLSVLGIASLVLPVAVASALPHTPYNTSLPPFPAMTSAQQDELRALSLLLLGAELTVLATLNFSLSLMLGIACAPLAFVRRMPAHGSDVLVGIQYAVLALTSPFGVGAAATIWSSVVRSGDVELLPRLLERLAFGWNVWGSWGVLVGVWAVWWPAWLIAALSVSSSWFDTDKEMADGSATPVAKKEGYVQRLQREAREDRERKRAEAEAADAEARRNRRAHEMAVGGGGGDGGGGGGAAESRKTK